MIHAKTILTALPNVLKTIELPTLGTKEHGKVRDFYVLPKYRVIITTDRQSAFDVNLGYIPFKGAVLNLLAGFWFEKTKHIIPNHMISIPHPNVLVAQNCQPIPIEMIVRGYISGVTKTSIWYSYERGEREIYGLQFPDGLHKNEKLPQPAITPTTHGGGAGGHDERLTREEIINRKLVPETLYTQMETAALELFAYGSALCQQRGLILVDTKYEFGLVQGKLTLMDEIHTPDSSRFWIAKTYGDRYKKGLEPENFDKEFLRLWYAQRGYRGDGAPPAMSNTLITDVARRYIAVYETVSGKKFTGYTYPVQTQIHRAVSTLDSVSYAKSGVNYSVVDPVKRLAQKQAARTVKSGDIREIPHSRGESAYVWEEDNGFRAMVMEGLGTKNLVADAMRRYTGKSYYDVIARDTVAMIVNDLIVVGAKPQTLTAYFAVGDSEWFSDEQRVQDLLKGWADACKSAGVVWGGGESPVLKDVIQPGTIDLAGSAIGIVSPKKRLTLGSKIKAGDAILLVESNGIHANGLTLARSIVDRLSDGYKTKLSDGTMYGDALLKPTHIYATLVDRLFSAGVDIHYMINITGHGWRKLMRAKESFSYTMTELPQVPVLFQFIQANAHIDDQEMYANFNMGAGFAFIIPQRDVELARHIITKQKFQNWHAGVVEKGKKKVCIQPLALVYTEDSLDIR